MLRANRVSTSFYNLHNSKRDTARQLPEEKIERQGYEITVKRNPFWSAETNLGAPYHFVHAYGFTKESAIANLLKRINELKGQSCTRPAA